MLSGSPGGPENLNINLYLSFLGFWTARNPKFKLLGSLGGARKLKFNLLGPPWVANTFKSKLSGVPGGPAA